MPGFVGGSTFLQTGLGAQVFAPQGNQGSTVGTSVVASAQGPRTIGQQGFGTVSGDSGGSNTCAYAVMGGGALALGVLVFIWWSLPR
jgi:hypothetical protein